jgi:hypothetical protein
MFLHELTKNIDFRSIRSYNRHIGERNDEAKNRARSTSKH